jgi:hypothetical protein
MDVGLAVAFSVYFVVVLGFVYLILVKLEKIEKLLIASKKSECEEGEADSAKSK